MEANELMTGDLLRVNKSGLCIKEGTIVRVYAIDSENSFPQIRLKGSATVKPIGQEDEISGGIWLAYLEPIPLTPEILEKNGFSKENKFEEEIGLGIYGDEENGCGIRQVEKYEWKFEKYYHPLGAPRRTFIVESALIIRYIHELQHALRLCGIKKELTI